MEAHYAYTGNGEPNELTIKLSSEHFSMAQWSLMLKHIFVAWQEKSPIEISGVPFFVERTETAMDSGLYHKIFIDLVECLGIDGNRPIYRLPSVGLPPGGNEV